MKMLMIHRQNIMVFTQVGNFGIIRDQLEENQQNKIQMRKKRFKKSVTEIS